MADPGSEKRGAPGVLGDFFENCSQFRVLFEVFAKKWGGGAPPAPPPLDPPLGLIFCSFYENTVSIVGSLRDREVACSASDRQGSNFESCVWRTVSSQSSHHP